MRNPFPRYSLVKKAKGKSKESTEIKQTSQQAPRQLNSVAIRAYMAYKKKQDTHLTHQERMKNVMAQIKKYPPLPSPRSENLSKLKASVKEIFRKKTDSSQPQTPKLELVRNEKKVELRQKYEELSRRYQCVQEEGAHQPSEHYEEETEQSEISEEQFQRQVVSVL